MKLICGDCLKELPKLANDGVRADLVLVDPPYGTMKNLKNKQYKSFEWDNILPIDKMFSNIEKILRKNGKCILFSQEPYTSTLRNTSYSNMKFAYPMIWEKNHFANCLSVKKSPVNYFEDLSVWQKQYDSECIHPLRKYSKRLVDEMGVSRKEIERKIGSGKADHFFRHDTLQFSICSHQTYEDLMNLFHIDQFDFFKSYDELKKIDSKFQSVFNLRGKKTKSNIFKYKKETDRYHVTQKPVALLEDLIQTFSNPGDLVIDFCMGSGSTGVACANTDRDFVGIELDESFFEIAEKRIKETKEQTNF